jgi:hypothetical protein
MNRDEQKKRYLRYRELAEKVHPNVRVFPTSHVMMCQGGAFVEVMVWVPESALVCKVCGGGGFIAEKQSIDDGYGEVDACPACS